MFQYDVELDGSFGSGGGQILRTALGLAVLTGKSCRIYNIRAKRKEAGLKEQHLQAVKALATLCDATVKGAYLGSQQLEFIPRAVKETLLNIKITTAGSVGLVLQALLIPAVKYNLQLHIEGGATFGKWAPPIYYINSVLSYFLRKIGCDVDIKVLREGFYPKGGAIVDVSTKLKQIKLEKLVAAEKGKLLCIEGISVASQSLKAARVAERQAEAASKLLYEKFKIKPEIAIRYDKTLCPGSGLQLWIETENSRLGADSFGERGKRSEIIGEEAAKKLIWEYEHGAVDSYAADQLLPYLALAGGKIAASKITEHAKTNIVVIEKFLPVKFVVEGNLISVGQVEQSSIRFKS